ncbi:hypothetical protein AMAG_17154 [Allomyces macrogynus ATCC 38327]|uniref:G-protein coupled receptors family 3 profile domain-containing protein n=1 Tax=Allomyces macrogynus (strain ATCC 38327) TaxID=578462 RepID=A0A0L0TDD9_ALLM3|nr:hypothetical protein AMAG_17154 [Allomyces macrogynus ATCC 38327]|eukprot:KNE72918.1 hypothetical protein AMAG_17154 [Allomyces macrogynus ATCC 38327]
MDPTRSMPLPRLPRRPPARRAHRPRSSWSISGLARTVIMATTTALLLLAVHAPAVVLATPWTFNIGVVLPFTGPDGTPYTSIETLYQLITTALPVMNSYNSTYYQFNLIRGNSMDSRSGAIAAMFDLYDKNNTVAYIGEAASGSTVPLVLAESRIRTWHCSGMASSTDLSKDDFPRFFRTIPDDSQQGVAIARFVKSMGWTHVNLLASTDSYGTSIGASFTEAARVLNITLSLSDVYPSGTQDMSVQVKNILNSESNVIVLAISSGDDAATLLREARKQGALDASHVWIGTDAMSEYLPFLNPSSPTYATDLANAQGVFFVYPLLATGSAPYREMEAAWAAMGKTTSPDSVAYGGLNYDCALALAKGLIQIAVKYGAENVTMKNLWLVNHFFTPPFDGATGTLAFTDTGDRLGDFSVWNMFAGAKRVAYNVYSNASVVLINAPQFYSGTAIPPPDIPPKTALYPTWSDPFVVATSVVRALLLALFSAGTGVLVIHRAKPMVKNLSFPFLVIITVGCQLVLVSEFVTVGEPTRVTCHAPVWILTIGYEMAMTSAAVKTYRIWRIFDKSMRRLRAINNEYLFRLVGSVILVQSIIFAIWLGAFPSTPVAVTSKQYLYYECRSSNPTGATAVTGVSIAINALLLAFVIFLGYKTRNVASSFRETLWIMYTSQNVGFVAIIVLSFSLISLSDFALGAYIVRTVLLIYAVLFTYMALVGRLVIALLRGAANVESASDAGKAGGTGTLTATGAATARAQAAMKVSLNHDTGKVAHVHGRYPVKETSRWFATWKTHAVHLYASDGYLALVPDSAETAGHLGTMVRLAGTTFDPNPVNYASCLAILSRGRSWVVQFEKDEDRDAWAKVMASVATVSAVSRSRSKDPRASGNKEAGKSGTSLPSVASEGVLATANTSRGMLPVRGAGAKD